MWSSRIDELNDEEAELCDFLADKGHDMQSHYRDDTRAKVQKVEQDESARAFRRTVDAVLDAARPVLRESATGVVSSRVALGAALGASDFHRLTDNA